MTTPTVKTVSPRKNPVLQTQIRSTGNKITLRNTNHILTSYKDVIQTTGNDPGLGLNYWISKEAQFKTKVKGGKEIAKDCLSDPITSVAASQQNDIILLGGGSNEFGKCGCAAFNLVSIGNFSFWNNCSREDQTSNIGRGFNFSMTGPSTTATTCTIDGSGYLAMMLQANTAVYPLPDGSSYAATEYNGYALVSTIKNGLVTWDSPKDPSNNSGTCFLPVLGMTSFDTSVGTDSLFYYDTGSNSQFIWGNQAQICLDAYSNNTNPNNVLVTGISYDNSNTGADQDAILGQLWSISPKKGNYLEQGNPSAEFCYYPKNSADYTKIVSAELIFSDTIGECNGVAVMANNRGKIHVWIGWSMGDGPWDTPVESGGDGYFFDTLYPTFELVLPEVDTTFGCVRTFDITNKGTGYSVGDELSLTNSFSIVVTGVTKKDGAVTGYYVKDKGSGFDENDIGFEKTLTGGGGSAFSVTITGLGYNIKVVANKNGDIFAVQEDMINGSSTTRYIYGWYHKKSQGIQGDEAGAWGQIYDKEAIGKFFIHKCYPDFQFASPTTFDNGLAWNDYSRFGEDLTVNNNLLCVSVGNLQKGDDYNYSAISYYSLPPLS